MSQPPSRKSPLKFRFVAAIAVAVLCIASLAIFLYPEWQIRQAKHYLAFKADHVAIRDACLALIRAKTPELEALEKKGDDPQIEVRSSDPAVEPALRAIAAGQISVRQQYVIVNAGGGGFIDHFGVTAVIDDPDFRAKFARDNRQIIPGLYYWGSTP